MRYFIILILLVVNLSAATLMLDEQRLVYDVFLSSRVSSAEPDKYDFFGANGVQIFGTNKVQLVETQLELPSDFTCLKYMLTPANTAYVVYQIKVSTGN